MAPPEATSPGTSSAAPQDQSDLGLVVIPEHALERLRRDTLDPDLRFRLLGAACRLNALSIIARAGSGHIGSSFSAMDIVLYLLLHELDVLSRRWEDLERDIFFSSKGHDVPALYAVLAALGKISLTDVLRLRRIDGPCGHPDRRCPLMETTTGSLGMGISKAKGMALARRATGRSGRVVVMVGDGELQEGQCWEGAQSAASLGLDNLAVIVDHNRVQSDRLVSDTMPLGNLAARFQALGWYVTRCDGHDRRALEAAFSRLDEMSGRPGLIIADTIKGKGVSFMEHPEALGLDGGIYRWHSGAPDEERYAAARGELLSTLDTLARSAGVACLPCESVPPHPRPVEEGGPSNLTGAFGEELVRLASVRPDLVVLDADLERDCGLSRFAREHPERFFEHGIAEQDMVTTAGGLAHQGLLPVVNSFAAFLVSRANEQIYLNACDGARIIYACHYAGLTPAGPGATHQSLRDTSLLAAIPGVLVVQPASELEVRRTLAFAVLSCTESVALRLQLGPAPEIVVPETGELEPGRGTVLAQGRDAVLFAYGPVMLHEALGARDLLAERGVSLRVVNMPWLNTVDVGWLAGVTGDVEHVWVLEDHAPLGALGDLLREAVTALHATGHTPARATETLGVEGLPAWGTREEVLEAHGLDATSLARRIGSGLRR